MTRRRCRASAAAESAAWRVNPCDSGEIRSSQSRTRIHFPVASSNPWFRAAAKSSRQRKSTTRAPWRRAIERVRSRDPVSTTMISSTSCCAESRQATMFFSSSQAIMQRLTTGGAQGVRVLGRLSRVLPRGLLISGRGLLLDLLGMATSLRNHGRCWAGLPPLTAPRPSPAKTASPLGGEGPARVPVPTVDNAFIGGRGRAAYRPGNIVSRKHATVKSR